MIKYIILLFNLSGLFLYQLFFQANVSINQSVPANADAGSSFVVEVTINKADVSGFAKFQEDLPKGFTATVIEKQGATVLSSDNAIKFIWASLPSDASVKVSFKVTVDASVTGAQTLSGKFLYVVNNERQQADASSSITINSTTPAVANTTQPATNTTAPENTTPATTNTVAPVTNTTTPETSTTNTVTPAANTTQPVANTTAPVTPAAPAASVNITRVYSAATVAPAGDINVTLTVHKGNLSGFAKLEESIPNGLVISEGDKQGASFTFVDNKAKFVWLNLPTDSVFTVSYKITASSTSSGEQSVSGEFSYLQDNNAQTYKVAPTSFTVQNTSAPVANTTQPAANTTQPETNTTNTVTPAANTTQPVANTTAPETNTTNTVTPAANTTQPVANTTAPETNTTNTVTPVTNTSQPDANSVTPNIPAANASVKYRVQIMALHNPVKASYLARKFSIAESIKEEMLEGYTKYTVGSFTEYKSVRDHREEVRSKGVQGPFVVAYNDGKRITVQEALMITHQQWYK